MKAFGYIRVSTEEQSKGFSLESQAKAINDYCRQHNINLIKIFEDHSSGARIDREELKAMMDELDYVDMVIVWKIDRLSRSVKDTVKLMEFFESKGKELISITEPFLSIKGDSQSKLMLHIFSSFAQYERDLIRERMMIGKLQKAKKGLVPAGKAPFGYRYENHGYKINEDEAKVVRLMFSKYIEYKTIGEVVKYLNKNGYRTRKGNRWTASTVNKILRNQIYKGIYIYNKRTSVKNKRWIKPKKEWIVIERKEWAIVDEDTFEKVQEILKLNSSKKEKSSNRLGTGLSLFGGLIECGLCGRRMVIKTTKRRTPYYLCKSFDEKIPCGNEKVYEPFLEEGVIELIEYLSSLSKKEIYLKIIEKTQDNKIEKQIKDLEKEIKSVQEIITRFTSEFEKFVIEGNPVPASLKEKLSEYEKKLESLKEEKVALLFEKQNSEKAVLKWEEFIELLKHLKDMLKVADRKDKKLFYKSILDKIVFTPEKVTAYVNEKKFEINYMPRILTLSKEDKKLLEEIGTVRAKIVLMAGETADKNQIASTLNTDQYLIDYCINMWKKGYIDVLKKDGSLDLKKSKSFEIIKKFIEDNNIDINKISARNLCKMINEKLNTNISEYSVRNAVYKLGKKRIRKF